LRVWVPLAPSLTCTALTVVLPVRSTVYVPLA
jgi:hypothetical protein